MTGEKLKEFMRRLNAEGFQFELDDNGAGTVYHRGREAAIITDEGEVRYKPGNRELAYHIHDVRKEVDEYMTAYQNADPGNPRFKNAPRTLMQFGGAELAMKLRENDIEFVSWDTAGGSRELGHYFSDYAAAKEDFSVRAGLVNKNRLFTETELTVIRSNLSDFLEIDGGAYINGEREDAIKEVVRKIDTVVVPKIEQQQERDIVQGEEPEMEM